MAKLRGMTWDHARGFDPMVATSAAYAAAHPGVEITWQKRSLQAFADRPIGAMAGEYDLMVIDHPHVGEAARQGTLMALDLPARADDLAAMAAQSVGLSHPSYEFDGRQWGLAIDAATPVAAFRPDLLEAAPRDWEQVLGLARAGKVGFALVPINALMTFFGLARNIGYPVAEDPERLMQPDHASHVLGLLAQIAALVDPRCLALDPIGVYEWMGRTEDAPAYSPFGYGYTNYSRDGYCRWPLVFADAPGVAGNGPRGTVLGGTGIAVSARTAHAALAVDYAYYVAGAACQSGLYFTSGGQPGNAVAWQSDACNAAAHNFFRNTRATLDSAWLRPRHDGYMRLQDAGGDIVHAHLRGEASAEQTIDRLDAAYRDSLR
ncbi:MAG: extracellular solute-binding protein [Paracoccaceae bacterium]